MTQASVSLIESGGDLRVSRLQQLAGALDLTLILAPRKLAALIDGVIASAQ